MLEGDDTRGGAFALFLCPHPGARGRALGFDTCFRKTVKFNGKDEAFVKDWLVHQGLAKLVDVFKGMFSQF